MRILITLLTIFLSTSLISQIVYFDNNDAVYTVPVAGTTTNHSFDIDQNGTNDIILDFSSIALSTNCGGSTSTIRRMTRFQSTTPNRLNSEGGGLSNPLTIDCTNDTLNILDDWSSATALIYEGIVHSNTPIVCFSQTIGEGTHKQGSRLVVPNGTGGNGYLYGYIDYSVTNNGDIIIHGWYYESTLNVPIDVNSELEYPYNSECIFIDTITYIDTTYVTITDTIFTSVTDTLFIDVNSAGQNSQLLSTIKVFPNPTNSVINIDNGNYIDINTYSMSIVSQQGQQVFSSSINQQFFSVNVSDFGSSGLYFLHIINDNGVIVDIRKIVIN
jgi:hypothetical protein